MFLVLVFQDRNSVLETLDVLLLLVPALAGGLPVQMYTVQCYYGSAKLAVNIKTITQM